jgi:uncharacterized protein YjbJ (UPF0337 family)
MKTGSRDQALGKAHHVKGKIKEMVGKVLDDPGLEAEGKAEKVGGAVQEKVGQIKKVLEK